jgi:alkaline phosphatase D
MYRVIMTAAFLQTFIVKLLPLEWWESPSKVVPKIDIVTPSKKKKKAAKVKGSLKSNKDIRLKDDPVSATNESHEMNPIRRNLIPLWTYNMIMGISHPNRDRLFDASWWSNTILCFLVLLSYCQQSYWYSENLSMVRVGYVGPDSAKFLLREPNSIYYPLEFLLREIPSHHPETDFTTAMDGIAAFKKVSSMAVFDVEHDYTRHVEIGELKADTTYQYSTSNDHYGYFKTAPKPGELPLMTNQTFTFFFTSCIFPNFPFQLRLNDPLYFRGLELLADAIPKQKPAFMLFLGDFIYADVPTPHSDSTKEFRRKYQNVYASKSWQKASYGLPWIHVADDHEIRNDWDKGEAHPYQNAMAPWHQYQASVNPPVVREGTTYYNFTHGPVSFFMLETRRHRTKESDDPNDDQKSMLGSLQLFDFLLWIATPPPKGVRFMVVASSVPFTKNWSFGTKDTWGGYLYERESILAAMRAYSQKNSVRFIVISGDRHEAATVVLKDDDLERGGDVWEFSVSPLNMFYLPTRTFQQVDEQDLVVDYSPNGNVKWGSIEVSPAPEPGEVDLKFRLFIYGEETFGVTVPSWTSPRRVTEA